MPNLSTLYVELRDTNNVLVDRIENRISNLSWEWKRVGGCGYCRFDLSTEFDSTLSKNLKPDYRIHIIVDGTTWYSGFIDKLAPKLTGDNEMISVNCLGFVHLLKFILISDTTYVGQELSAIAEDILSNEVVGISDITSNSANYDDTGFSPDTLTFNTTVYEALKTLADIAGKREWGVDADKAFFFKTRSSSVNHHIFLDEDVETFSISLDYSKLASSIVVEGGKVDGELFTLPLNLTGAGYTREKRITYGSITTQTVASKLGRAYLKEYGLPKRTYKLSRKTDQRLEETLPIGLIAINLKNGINIAYDHSYLYDDGHKYDGGTESFQLESIKYQVLDNNQLQTDISAGVLPADIVETISQQKFLLDQVKNY